MKYKAHDYQQYATDFIIEHPVSCLILDMGLGKTVITLTALWLLLFDYFEVRRILVIAPKRVAETTWPAEIKKWEHLYGMTFAVVPHGDRKGNEVITAHAYHNCNDRSAKMVGYLNIIYIYIYIIFIHTYYI